MLLQEAMDKLQSLGTEQTRKTYRRHGSGDNVFGVLFGDLKILAKSIKRDHRLACQLWETNFDASFTPVGPRMETGPTGLFCHSNGRLSNARFRWMGTTSAHLITDK